jgi:hypothetical protein
MKTDIKILLQSKRDPKRTIEVTPVQWGQMIEIGKHKEWKVLNPEETKKAEAALLKVDESMADYIAKKKKILPTVTTPILKEEAVYPEVNAGETIKVITKKQTKQK